MAMAAYFSDKSFRFLRALARHNERAWFHAEGRRLKARLHGLLAED